MKLLLLFFLLAFGFNIYQQRRYDFLLTEHRRLQSSLKSSLKKKRISLGLKNASREKI